MEFHFQSDARLEARRAGFADDAMKQLQPTYPPIPDFKTFHEAQARDAAARKDHIVPVQPQGFHFSTETRAQDREKYDEARRARELEAERLLEEDALATEVQYGASLMRVHVSAFLSLTDIL